MLLAFIGILIGLIFMVWATIHFLRQVVEKRRMEGQDVKSWVTTIMDAFWGMGGMG